MSRVKHNVSALPNLTLYVHIRDTLTIRLQKLRSMQPDPNVYIGIGPMCVSVSVCVCALMENQSVIGIEVTEVSKEEEKLKCRKSA